MPSGTRISATQDAFAGSFNIFGGTFEYKPDGYQQRQQAKPAAAAAAAPPVQRRMPSAYGEYGGRLQGTRMFSVVGPAPAPSRPAQRKAEVLEQTDGGKWDGRLHAIYRAAEQSVGGAGEVRELLDRVKTALSRSCRSSKAKQLWCSRAFGQSAASFGQEHFTEAVASLVPDLSDAEACALFGYVDRDCCGAVSLQDFSRALTGSYQQEKKTMKRQAKSVRPSNDGPVSMCLAAHTHDQGRQMLVRAPSEDVSVAEENGYGDSAEAGQAWKLAGPGAASSRQEAPLVPISGCPIVVQQLGDGQTMFRVACAPQSESDSEGESAGANTAGAMRGSGRGRSRGMSRRGSKPSNWRYFWSRETARAFQAQSDGRPQALRRRQHHQHQHQHQHGEYGRQNGQMPPLAEHPPKSLLDGSFSLDNDGNGNNGGDEYGDGDYDDGSSGVGDGGGIGVGFRGLQEQRRQREQQRRQRRQWGEQQHQEEQEQEEEQEGQRQEREEQEQRERQENEWAQEQIDRGLVPPQYDLGGHPMSKRAQQKWLWAEQAKQLREQKEVDEQGQRWLGKQFGFKRGFGAGMGESMLVRSAAVGAASGAAGATGATGGADAGRNPKSLLEDYHLGPVISSGAFASVRKGFRRVRAGGNRDRDGSASRAGYSSGGGGADEEGEAVAIKTYDKRKILQQADAGKIRHLEQDIALVGKLRHPNVACAKEIYETPTHVHLVMECCEGGTLAEYVDGLWKKQRAQYRQQQQQQGGGGMETVLAGLFAQVCEGVRYLHRTHFCHRDIKLENCVVALDDDVNDSTHHRNRTHNSSNPADSCTVKLVDFGLGAKTAPKVCSTVCGSPEYMAPELVSAIQLRQSRNGNGGQQQQMLTQRISYSGKPVDIWSLGVLLYVLVSGGTFPFSRDLGDGDKKDVHAVFTNIKTGRFDLPTLGKGPRAAPVSAECGALLRSMLRVAPEKRPTIEEVCAHPFIARAAAAAAAAQQQQRG